MAEYTIADKIHRTHFLGREFLTWLLFRAFRDQAIQIDDKTVGVSFERAVTLDGENPAREMSAIKVDEPAQSSEVMLSLKLGKKVSKARVILTVDGNEFKTGIDSATLSLKSLKLPEVKAQEFIERLDEKMELTQCVEQAVWDLFVHFVRLRLDGDEWAREADEIARWIESDDIFG